METLRDLVEEIARLVDEAQTHALLGERRTALNLILQASRLYEEFVSVISGYSDVSVLLDQIVAITRNLCMEASAEE